MGRFAGFPAALASRPGGFTSWVLREWVFCDCEVSTLTSIRSHARVLMCPDPHWWMGLRLCPLAASPPRARGPWWCLEAPEVHVREGNSCASASLPPRGGDRALGR